MTDSVKIVDENFQKNDSHVRGKLHKGHNIAAASSSIPSKYQTIVTDNSENKGFQSCSKRFRHDVSIDENPGPGSYVTHNKVFSTSPSYSKKGTGGFASKDVRIGKYVGSIGPGPLGYNLPSMLVSRKDFNKSSSTRSFQKPIAISSTDKKLSTPAPNSYSINDYNTSRTKTNNVAALAAFKSQSKRNEIIMGDVKNPAPGQYNINDEQIRANVPASTSSFRSGTHRKLLAEPTQVPGPGSYRPFEPTEAVARVIFPKKHYLCISAPAMPLPKTPPLPGPGTYETLNHDREQKHYMSGSVFVSATSRWSNGEVKNREFPGPAHYRPIENVRPSFIYNASGRWI